VLIRGFLKNEANRQPVAGNPKHEYRNPKQMELNKQSQFWCFTAEDAEGAEIFGLEMRFSAASATSAVNENEKTKPIVSC